MKTKRMNKLKDGEYLESVKKFHEMFGLPVIDRPKIPAKDRCELRVSLIQEELNELKEALENNDLIEVIDALADLQYVLSGAVLEFGFASDFSKFFDEVQRSNMSKVCDDMETAEATVEYYKEKDQEGVIEQKKDGRYIVYRKSDGKVLKSTKYSPADIVGMFEHLEV